MPTIDENLNVVLPVVTERVTTKTKVKEGDKEIEKDVSENVVRVYAYHTPVSKAVFDANYRMLAATKSALASKGQHYLVTSGPRIAALTLKDEGYRDAEIRGRIDDNGQVRDDDTPAFLAELKRLTNILCPSASGWEMLPVDAAIAQEKIDIEDWEETLSAIVFFTCQWSMAKKSDRIRMGKATASLIGASTTSSPLSQFAASLPSLTPVTATPKAVSSLPS